MIALILCNALLSFVFAQGCGKDVLVDDFSTTQSKFFDNADRVINKIGGDYGTDGNTTFTIDTNAQTLTVIPQQNENIFFFAKFDEIACFDLTNFYAFQFDLIGPVGSTGSFTLTQMSADCSGRVANGDSTYLPLAKYYTTPGQKQTVTLPFKDFTALASGNGTFDFVHLKDWTFVNPLPLGEAFVFSNMMLIGGAPGCNGTAVTDGSSTPAVTDGSSILNTSTGSRPSSNDAEPRSFSVGMLMIFLLFTWSL